MHDTVPCGQCQYKATNPFCVLHTKRVGKDLITGIGGLGLHNGSKNHRAVEGRSYMGRKLYLAKAERLAHLHSGNIAGNAAGNILNGALHRNLVHDLVYYTTHTHANGSTCKLNSHFGLNNGVGRYSLEVEVHGGIGKEATLHVLNHGKHLGAVKIKLYQHAVGVGSVEESAHIRDFGLDVDIALYGRTVYHAGNKALSAKSIEFTCTANLTFGDVECKSRHNDDMMDEIEFCLSSSDVGARVLSPAGLVSLLPQGKSGRRGCHFY